MNFLNNFFNIADYYLRKKRVPEEQPQRISKCQFYFEKIYHLLSWENITFTLIIFLALNYLFWLTVQLEIRIIGFLSLLCLILFIWDSFFTNPEELYSPAKYADVFNDLKIIVYDNLLNLKAFRKENPSTFCISMSLAFFILRLISKTVSGYEAAYFMLLLTFFIPLTFKLLPEEQAENYKSWMKSAFNVTGILAEEELIPFINDKDFANRDNDLDSLLTDRTADSVSTSLISGISTMPSYLDVGDTQSDVQEEDLLPNRSVPNDFSSDSDSENKEISFASSHFSRDSSSEDERMLEKDIEFNNDALDSINTSAYPGVLSNIATLGNSLVGNVFKVLTSKDTLQVKRQNSSSSSSDFEFVDTDDIK